jgi:hypothetical protein
VPGRATLIQYQLPTRNIDSKACLPRFDYCSPAAQRRVLQHIPGESGHDLLRRECPLMTQSGHLNGNKQRKSAIGVHPLLPAVKREAEEDWGR